MNNGSKEKILVYADVHGNYDALKKLKKSHDYKTATNYILLLCYIILIWYNFVVLKQKENFNEFIWRVF